MRYGNSKTLAAEEKFEAWWKAPLGHHAPPEVKDLAKRGFVAGWVARAIDAGEDHTAALEAENARLRELVQALDGLLSVYRTTDWRRGAKAGDRVTAARAALTSPDRTTAAPNGQE